MKLNLPKSVPNSNKDLEEKVYLASAIITDLDISTTDVKGTGELGKITKRVMY